MNSVEGDSLFRNRLPEEDFTRRKDVHGGLDVCHSAQRPFRHPGLEPGSSHGASALWEESFSAQRLGLAAFRLKAGMTGLMLR
ncbi:hypothetical protein AGR2A_Cc160280 [Agrobacterium genomosp. 2 str. CFBP 5494]|uniref:Uncharacterized protein n=1 Tax=Agrobacterium genomosp. 2 str. CFBP 5494 TaxID=1183436 RepID=A0A9W5B0T8_9HYPH|nr:hypothetical protein AGR2A_Cc160280 [Agrobacterium genomosp. 2 str. CFBP 5494]